MADRVRPPFTLWRWAGAVLILPLLWAGPATADFPPARKPLAWQPAQTQDDLPARQAPGRRGAATGESLARDITGGNGGRYDDLIANVAAEFNLDLHLMHAVIAAESSYNAKAVSPVGALGLMQVMPTTGKRFGFTRLEDPQVNLRAGATYLKWLLEKFDGNVKLAVAAYNAGEGAVMRHGSKVPPYPETRTYVKRVLTRYNATSGKALKIPVYAKDAKPGQSTKKSSGPAARATKETRKKRTTASKPSKSNETLAAIGKLMGVLLSTPE